MSSFSGCLYLLQSPHCCNHIVSIVHWFFYLVSSGSNNILSQLHTWLHVEEHFNDSCLIHPYIWMVRILRYIIRVVSASQGIVAILCYSCISSVDSMIFMYVYWLCSIPVCGISGVLKVKSDFTYSLNNLFILLITYVW